MVDMHITRATPTLELHGKGLDDFLRADERDGHFNITTQQQRVGGDNGGNGFETSIALDRTHAKRLADWIYGRLGIANETPA